MSVLCTYNKTKPKVGAKCADATSYFTVHHWPAIIFVNCVLELNYDLVVSTSCAKRSYCVSVSGSTFGSIVRFNI